MHIQLNNVLPYPIEASNLTDTSAWNSNLTFNSEKKIVLEAVSGKGKSTFINLLNGSRNDYTGEILFDGVDIKTFSHQNWSEIRSNKIATVFQDLKLIEEFTVLENIAIKNKLTNYFTDNQILSLIERVGLTTKINTKTKFLSYGQKQRVAIIRALAQPFKLLLLDEPFSHLDVENQKVIIDIINENIEKNNAGFVLTSLNNAHPIKYDSILTL